MSTAMVSIYDFGDHVSYRTNNASTLQNQKNGFGSQVERKTNLSTTVYNSVQANNANNNNNNNINIVNNNSVNNVSRRIVTASASVPIGIATALASQHRSLPPLQTTVQQSLQPLQQLQQPLQQSTAMHPKASIGVMSNNNTQPSPVALVRGVSTGSQTCNAINNNNNSMNNGNININMNNKEHKKLDRSYSEPAEKSQQVLRLNSSSTSVAGPMSSRYKTELCRSFAEVGTCKYGDKCQFAHGGHELRVITRHPKFKTENCKSFHSTGFCPYGPRCHFIHNSEESKKNILNNLQSNGCNGVNTANGCQPRCGNDQIITTNMANMNGNAAVTNSGFAATYHTTNSNSIPLRPKALSIGSYSLCSSGEISPPSSQSGSPTSLNSFFTEDTFNSFASPTNHTLGSCANNAFSFSPDFASLVQSTQIKSNGLSTFETTSSALCQAFPLSTSLNADMCDQQQVSPLYSSSYNTSVSTPLDHNHVNDTISGMSRTDTVTPTLIPLARETPVKAVSAPVLYPTSPESPVDSISSDVETLRLECDDSLSPIPTCSSPDDSSLKGILRLPIFTRFANNGTNSSNNELE